MFGKKAKAEPAQEAKKTSTKAQANTPAAASTPQAEPQKTLSPREKREAALQEKYKKIEETKQKIKEAQAQKLKREKERREELKKKHLRALITFTIGLLVMLTALIALFPSPTMIVFSTLLMFTFFFLGFAFQKAIMQLMVIALACVVITGAFYSIITQL